MRGKASPNKAIATYSAQETQSGTPEVMSPNVAIKGAEIETRRPHAMRIPHPTPRCFVVRHAGVYLTKVSSKRSGEEEGRAAYP